MVRLLPPQASLEHLKHQAKDLLAASRAGEAVALARLGRWFPTLTSAAAAAAPTGGASPVAGDDGSPPRLPAPPLRLNQAQLALAREYGFPSWARLVAWVSRGEVPGDPDAQVELLGTRSWRVHRAAQAALVAAGAAGIAAAIRGLSHPSPRVRQGAAGFMDHFADDGCVDRLAELALHDPVPYVRRVAVHALLCQKCKPAPLTVDVLPLLLRVARADLSPRVRYTALWGLGQQRCDARVVAALTTVLREESRPDLRGAAHQALKRQSPEYRQQAARRAREARPSGRRRPDTGG